MLYSIQIQAAAALKKAVLKSSVQEIARECGASAAQQTSRSMTMY